MTLEGESLPQGRTYREDMLRDHSLSELRWRICRDSWLDDRFCFVHLKQGCYSCWTSDRPAQQLWKREVTERPLDVAQSGWIAKYNRTLFDVEWASNRGASGTCKGFPFSFTFSDSSPFMIPFSFTSGRPEESLAAASNCDQGHDYTYRGDLGAPQYGPQYSGHYQPRQSPVEGRHGGTVGPTAQDDVDVAVNRALDAQLGPERAEDVAWCAERMTEQLRQSNRELLARLRVYWEVLKLRLARASGRLGRMDRWRVKLVYGRLFSDAELDAMETCIPGQEESVLSASRVEAEKEKYAKELEDRLYPLDEVELLKRKARNAESQREPSLFGSRFFAKLTSGDARTD
ncbi:hypothetical protein PHMEG_0006499 [Phytophthora megakarya]|uniref:Uncharacterized protein n=1 Tax=Phytophthora megakarya TaxID=4795 RepID=A0A225WNW1_9STRA|nr:hypothetical protein PHMEG_0006499 [Phytophthora megakarya]